jgi:D-glycero-D-manno-heptose 1,7-bisphosphate phosphatase
VQRTVFLDRDGVINRAVVRDGKAYAPALVDDLEILPGVADALDRLRAAGYRLVVVTNQPDIARGTVTRAAVDAINARLAARLGLDDIRVCPHDDGDGCDCRKPKPGMLLWPPHADLPASLMVGDRWRDIEAGRAAGVGATILVDYHYDEGLRHEPDVRVASLAEATDWILARDLRRAAAADAP